jgi:hypothetical protein
VKAALTGETQTDRLTRITNLAKLHQGEDDFTIFSENITNAYQRITNDWAGKTIPVDSLLTAFLLLNCNQTVLLGKSD